MLALLLAALADARKVPYVVDQLATPSDAVLEVGGMDWLPDGRLVVSTRRGQVWIVENALDPDPSAARYRLFCEGLQEGLGLKVVDGAVYVLQRGELSRLVDRDQDGVAERIETVTDRFGLSGNYHEFAFGLPVDSRGHFFVSLNLGFTEPKWWHGRSLAPWRGWVLDVAPDGSVTPFASGFRSPCGIGTNAAGDLFVTDNQGDWVPVCPLIHVQKDRFYGAPASLVWTEAYQKSGTEPSLENPVDAERTPPACWIPYAWSRSTGDMRAIPADGSFGPFEGQLALAELTNGMVLRADLEKVRGEYQGAVFPLVEDVGSAIRALFAPDGTLLLGLTNRGWGGKAPGHGIARVRYGKRPPFEVRHVRLLDDGFALELTEPLAGGIAIGPEDVSIALHHYDWWWEYGSPERDDGPCAVSAIEVADDRRHLVVRAPLAAGHVARVTLKGLASATGQALLHPEFAYTINQLPSGPVCTTPVARVAPPPPPRASKEEGWLRLTYGDALELWPKSEGWKLVHAELDTDHPERFKICPGNTALVNEADGERALVSSPQFGDGRFQVHVMLARGAAATVLVQGRYGIRVSDRAGLSSGAIVGASGAEDRPPKSAFETVPGNWHRLEVEFRAPRFDARGGILEKARFVEVLLDSVLVQKDVELTGPSAGALGREVERGPLVCIGTPRDVGFADVRAKPVPPARGAGWTALLGEDDLEGWRASEGMEWKREEGLLTTNGGDGRLVLARAGLVEGRLRARVRIGGCGLGALVLRAPADQGARTGIGVLLNADHPQPFRTGTLLALDDSLEVASKSAPGSWRRVGLVAAGTWFDLGVEWRAIGEKNLRVSVFLSGALVNTADFALGEGMGEALALWNHHAGSGFEVQSLEYQPLSPPASDRSSPPPR